MGKPYSWEEIKQVLQKELRLTSHLLTYGVIGSCDVEHDIDTIITKRPNSKSSDFFMEIHGLFERIDDYLQQNHNCRLIRTSRFSDEEETKHIAGYSSDDLVFQVMTYVSLSQIEKHWHADLGLHESVRRLLRNKYVLLFGDVDDLFTDDFKENSQDYLFIRLNDSDRINSHFPTPFLIQRMNVLFDFILKKRLGLEISKAKNLIEMKKRFYDLCDELDRQDEKSRLA